MSKNRTMSEQAAHESRGQRSGSLTDGKKTVLSVLATIPLVPLLFYSFGWFETNMVNGVVVRDGIDLTSTIVAVCCGIFFNAVLWLFID